MAHRTERTDPRRRAAHRFGPGLLLLFLPLLVGLGVTSASGAPDYGAWWLTNTTPPTLVLGSAGDVVRGQARINVQLEPNGRASVVEAEIDGRPVMVTDPLALDTTTLQDGEHRLMVTVQDFSWRRNRATASLGIRSDNTPPQLMLEWRPDRVAQGSTWLLRVRAGEPATLEGSLDGRSLGLQVGDGFGWAVVGLPPDVRPAAIPLVIVATDRAGNRAEWQGGVEVVPAQFPRDSLEVPPDLLPLLGPEVRAEEDARLAPTYATVTERRLWEGPFLMPTRGPVVTEFGEVRSYNGGPEVGHHAGVDFAAPADRPVVAPNRGRVALIDEARLRGRVLVLDHGLGVFTTYAHLSAVDVQVDQLVERGQPFARVGSTGLSTGPHLHWEMWVGGANVDPITWTQREIP